MSYVRERFPRSAVKQLQQSEHEERSVHLQGQKFSGVLLDQHRLFVHCFLECTVLNPDVDMDQEELYFSLFYSIQSYKAKKGHSFQRLGQQWKSQNYSGCSSKLLSLSKTWKETTLLTTCSFWNVSSLSLLKYHEDPCKVIVRISQIIHSGIIKHHKVIQ